MGLLSDSPGPAGAGGTGGGTGEEASNGKHSLPDSISAARPTAPA